MKNTKTIISITALLLFALLFIEQRATADSEFKTSQQITGNDIVVYGSNHYGNAEMIEINLTDNTFQQVGYASVPNQAMAQDPLTNFVYYFESESSGDEFAYFDPVTQLNTTVRDFDSAPGFYAKRMDFAPDGTLYMMDNHDRLYTMDKTTGDFTYLGNVSGLITGDYTGTGDMAFAPDGTLYVATYENIYTVDIGSRTSTLLFGEMFDQPEGEIAVWTGLAYCDGNLYGSSGEGTPDGGVSAIYRINPTTGQTDQLIGNVGVIINDLSSCRPKVEFCNVADDTSYDFFIDPFNATIDIDTLGTLDCISMNRLNASHPQATTHLDTGTYWDIQGLDSGGATAVNFEVTLTLQTDFTTDAQDKVCRYTGSGWDCALTSFGPNSLTRSGITEFSQWTAGNDAGPTAVSLQSVSAHQNLSSILIWLFTLLMLTGATIWGLRRHSPRQKP